MVMLVSTTGLHTTGVHFKQERGSVVGLSLQGNLAATKAKKRPGAFELQRRRPGVRVEKAGAALYT